MSMAVRKNDFMPSWLQSPNGEGQKAWKSGSGRDGLFSSSESHPPVVPTNAPADTRRYPALSSHDSVSTRRPQRALSFEAAPEHSGYSRPVRPPPSAYRRQSFKSDYAVGGGSGNATSNGSNSSSTGGNGASNVESFSRLPRQHRSVDGWPRTEPTSSNQGLERNFHQHFPTLRGTSAAPDQSSNPGGAWDNRYSQPSSRSHYTHANSNSSYDGRRLPRPASYSVDNSPTEDESTASRSNLRAGARPDRISSAHHDSQAESVRTSTAERSNMRLNLSLNTASQADSEKASALLRQGKVQSPNQPGKVTLRSLSKSETWKGQKVEEPPAAPVTSAHSAVAPWSSQAPPPAPALPRSSVARTPEAPAVLLQRQIETRSKGTSESRLNFFKSLQGDGSVSSNEGSPTDLTPASASRRLLGQQDVLNQSSDINSVEHDDHQENLGTMDVDPSTLEELSAEEQQQNSAIDRDHLTASFYDVIIDSGKIPFDDADDVNEEDQRVMKVWGWTPDAYDNVECITLGEVATFQALLRSYVNEKLQTGFLANGSLGAQRLFQRHCHHLTIPSTIGNSLSSSDCSEESVSPASSSSDEDRK
eukprot:scpid55159/ scgid25510/ 